MANEASIINNPTSTPVAVSTGYQRQNVRMVAVSNGIDHTVVEAGAGKVTVKKSGPVDVNGVLYSITTEVDLTITGGAGKYVIYLEGSGNNLSPKLNPVGDIGTFSALKNARYTDVTQYRILNWIVSYDGTTVQVCKLLTPEYGQNYLPDIDEPHEEWIVANGTWTAPRSKYYTIWMTGKGGNSNSTSGADKCTGAGGAGLTGQKRIYIEAGTLWTAAFSTASGGDLTFTDGVTTLSVQNGYNGGAESSVESDGGQGGLSSSGVDISFLGGDGGDSRYDSGAPGGAEGKLGIGGASIYGGGGVLATTPSTSGDGNSYGSGAGGVGGNAGAISGKTGASGVIRIIG
jgi:hypothetical protein